MATDVDILDDHNVAYNTKTGEQENMVLVSDLSNPATAQQLFESLDVAKSFTKRRWMLGVLLSVLTVTAMTDGLLIVVRVQLAQVPISALIICFYANGIALSVVIYAAMVHARLHAEDIRLRLWFCIGGAWTVALACSALPALLSLDALAAATLNHRAYLALNGVAAGGLLKLHFYYNNMGIGRRWGWRESCAGAAVGTIAALQSMLTGVFL